MKRVLAWRIHMERVKGVVAGDGNYGEGLDIFFFFCVAIKIQALRYTNVF